MTLQAHAASATARSELGELYSSYKQLVMALAAGLILEGDLGAVTDHAALLQLRCACALATAGSAGGIARATASVARAVDELVVTLALVRRRDDDAEAGLERVRQRHRSLRREIWGVLPFEYPSCASDHSHGGHAHADEQPSDRSDNT